LSPQVFKEGVRIYFSKYANGNTTLKDFVNCLQIAKKEEGVYEWVDSWLTTKGVMQVENEIQSENGQIKNFKIK